MMTMAFRLTMSTALITAAAVATANLVTNGDFEAGDTGFGSDYASTVHDGGNIQNPAVYHVGTNPNAVHPSFAVMGDHTTGATNMMIVNGSFDITDRVWFQSIAVTPNTDYFFSTYIASVHPGSPAILDFSINGVQLGFTFNASSTTGVWEQFYATWNSGANLSADIAIVNQNPDLGGNDFALDDINFGTDLVPEPATCLVLGMGALASLRKRSRR